MTAPQSASPSLVAPADDRLAFLEAFIRRRSIVTSAQQRIVSPNGREQTWLVDLRPVLLNGRALSYIAQLFWERFAGALPFQIGGLESACIPLLSAIVLEGEQRGISLNAFIVRKERKTSGLALDVEGDITDDPVIAVDDLTNSSESLEKVRVVVADRGKRLARVFVVVDFQAPASKKWRARHGIEVEALLDAARFGMPGAANPPRIPAHHFEPLWSSAALDANHFIVAPRSSPAYDGQKIYVGTDGGELRALDARTGTEAWSFRAEATSRKGIWSSPALSADRVVFGAYNGSVYCLDTASGHEVWRADVAEWVGSSPIIAHRHGLVLVGLEHATPAAKGSVAALDLATGAKVWEHHVPEFIHCSPTLSPDQGQVFIGTNGGELLCLDTLTGDLRWQYRTDNALKAAPAVSDRLGVVVVGSFDHSVHVVAAATGQPLSVVKTGGPVYSTPLIVGEAAYIGSQDKTLYVVDLIDGSVIKTFSLGARIFATPTLLDGIVYVGTTGGKLFGIDPVTLSIRDVLQLPDRILNPPILVADGSILVVPAFGNRLFAFQFDTVGPRVPSAAPPATTAPRTKALPFAAAVIDGARAEGVYFRINEPTGQPVSRPFAAMPSRRLLGAAAMLLMFTDGYRDLSQADAEARILPALLANQARVFLHGLQPIGMVTWARLSEGAERRFSKEGALPKPTEWTSGNRLWIVDVIAPFGASRPMLDKVRRETLRGRTVHLLRQNPDGSYDIETLPP
ncbi:MAG: PQQ-binding-like beta-propeller repeat protein [Reyranella sp.]|nr:PQQ-binding-like beta-propeller repeat protein [Reyranella sp.]